MTVSTDTEYTHLAWHRHEHGLQMVKYPMAADHNGSVSRLFGVYDEESGEAFRGTFIINPAGTLVSKEVNLNNVGRNIDELMRKFKAFLHVTKHPVKACPSKWKDEGDLTLEPSAKLVGKVFQSDGSLVG